MTHTKRIGWALLAYISAYAAVRAWLYTAGDPQNYTEIFREKYILHHQLVLVHAAASTLALALGPWQFHPGLRRHRPRLHRAFGYAYLVGVLVGSESGLQMAFMAEGGAFSRLGFVCMAVLWAATAILALRAILRRDLPGHEAWMMRNFALTFGAVMLRVYIHSATALGFAFADAYPWTSWMGWLLNLVVVELYRRRKKARYG